jgi:hypothetical protein
MNYQTTY